MNPILLATTSEWSEKACHENIKQCSKIRQIQTPMQGMRCSQGNLLTFFFRLVTISKAMLALYSVYTYRYKGGIQSHFKIEAVQGILDIVKRSDLKLFVRSDSKLGNRGTLAGNLVTINFYVTF